jgi:hypothetical protein
MLNLLIGAIVVYLGWRLWKGPTRRSPPAARRPARAIDDEADALAVLGLPRDAGDDDIRAAHRRLIAAVHPDRGGSAELARRINLARDVLLKRID